MPIQPGLVLRWFHDEYLPYRLWQCMNNIQVAQPHVDKLAHQFAVWYLELYPKALMGQAMHARLSFIEAEALARTETHGVTLLVVLDGLHSGEEAGVAVAPTACSSARSSALAMVVSRQLRTDSYSHHCPLLQSFVSQRFFEGYRQRAWIR